MTDNDRRWADVPHFVQGHQLIQFHDRSAFDYGAPDVPVTELDDADGISSFAAGGVNLETTASSVGYYSRHRPILDIDFEAVLVESSTEGHYHLYLDKLMPWSDYRLLLDVLAKVGIIEQGYADASLDRGYSNVRLPWITKGMMPRVGDDDIDPTQQHYPPINPDSPF